LGDLDTKCIFPLRVVRSPLRKREGQMQMIGEAQEILKTRLLKRCNLLFLSLLLEKASF